jgi:hypothetical protein
VKNEERKEEIKDRWAILPITPSLTPTPLDKNSPCKAKHN